jgi:peroxiredoxin
MPGQITEIRRARADDSQIHRDVTISRDDRNALRDAADLIEVRFPILASNVRGVIEKWDANEATEIYIDENGNWGDGGEVS